MTEIRGKDQPAINCKRIVISCLSAEVFPFVEDCDTYEEIVATLRNIYVKPTNNVFARYLLVSRNQGFTESVSDFLQALKVLAKNCTFTAVSANDYREQLIRDSFIKGLNSSFIKQRLLEHGDLTLTRAIELAETLDSAQRQSSSMGTTASS